MNTSPNWLEAARAHWNWRGQTRPPFAVVPGPGQVSVWDFPRPPRLVNDSREVVIRWGDLEVAHTRHAVLVLETSHPPSFYIPLTDVDQSLLREGTSSSFCEWKGPASYWSLVSKTQVLPNVGWAYPHPISGGIDDKEGGEGKQGKGLGAEALAKCIAFYPTHLTCTVGGEKVTPQPGGFYGGWITPELVGPFKSEAGTQGW